MAINKECLDKALAAAGEQLSEREMTKLLESFQKRIERKINKEGYRGRETLDANIIKEAQDFANELKTEAALKKRQTMVNTFAARYRSDIIGQLPHDPALAMEALNVGINKPIKGARASVDARQKAIHLDFMGTLVSDLRKGNLLELWQKSDAAFDRDISREMWELGKESGTPGITKIPEAKAIAKIVHDLQEATRIMKNDAGAYIRKMPGYIVMQSHDMSKIFREGFDKWAQDVLPKLDEKTFYGGIDSAADRMEFLKNTYDDIVTGKYYQTENMEASGFRLVNLADKNSRSRLLHFKDADGWFDYNSKYGLGSMREAVVAGLRKSAQDIGLMQVWGTNPRNAFEKTLEDMKNGSRDNKKVYDKLGRQYLKNQFETVDGSMNIPSDPRLAKIGQGIRALQTLAKGGGFVLSSISDIATVGQEFRYQRGSFLKGHQLALEAALTRVPKHLRAETSDLIGVGLEGASGAFATRIGGGDDATGVGAKLMHKFFKLNLLTPWTDSLKTGVGMIMSRDLANNAHLKFSELGEDLQRNLGLYKIEERDWDVMRKNVKTAEDGRQYMTPDIAQDIHADDLKNYHVGYEPSEEQMRRTRNDIENKIRMYHVDRTDYAVTTPDARDRALLMQGTKPGTPIGEALRLVMQFKSFSAGFISKNWGREIYGRGAPVWYKGDLKGIAQLILTTTAMGYLSASAKNIVRGQTPRDPSDPKTWIAALAQGGSMGIYGDFLFGESNRFGQDPLVTTLGPTAGSVSDLMKLYGAAKNGDDVAAKALRVAQSHTPFINLFYTKMALDYFIMNDMQEAINPGSLRRSEQNLQKNSGQQYLLPPSENRAHPFTQ